MWRILIKKTTESYLKTSKKTIINEEIQQRERIIILKMPILAKLKE